MQDLNHVALIGRLTRDAKVSNVANTTKADLSLAVNRSRKNGEQWVDEVSYIDVLVWKPSEWLVGKLTKGQQVAVDGYLKQDRWEKDGNKFSKVSVVSNQIQVIGSNGASASTSDVTSSPAESVDDFSSDIPF